MSDVGDYTIGCICAIVDEAVALRSFFDQTHVSPDTASGKRYTTGTIYNHKVVIARLPSGSYGISDATNVVVHMASDFPNIRFCMMVGIGGGVPDPSKQNRDIRLGDIVVSSPANGTGGVIQYDHGKAIQDQPFHDTQHLNRPPDALLDVVSILAEDYQMAGHNLQNMVKEVLEKNPRLLQQGFQRPDENSDRLYKSDYVHRLGAEGSCSTLCGDSTEHLVPRTLREARLDDPMIYRGIIGSGSRVVKDAKFRDSLAKEKDILCFEMEAAGLMNRLPCLVIRGICDYSDSHKNDHWQRYAAMMAAAYATEVLRILQPQTVAAEKKLGDVLKVMEERIGTRIAAVGDVVKEVKRSQQETRDEERQEKILQWLTPIDYSSTQNQLQRERIEGTGLWFLSLEGFRIWLQENGRALYCPGPPGAGKTHIASLVIYHIQSTKVDVSRPGLAYIYCNYRQHSTHTMLDFIASLLKQLVRAQGSFPTQLEELYTRHKLENMQPSSEKLRGILYDVVSSHKRCFIIVDGLDECREDEGVRECLLQLLEDLRARSGANILVTSRYIQQLLNYFRDHGYPRIDIKASNEDMNRFLDNRIPQVSPVLRRNRALHEDVRTAIMLVADGLFLVAMLHVTSLKGKVNVKQIKDALQSLSTGGDALLKAYDKTMEMIQSQEEETRSLAMSTLSWVAFSPSPLTLEMVQHALAVEIGDDALDVDNVTESEIILSTCAGLLALQETTYERKTTWQVGLVHETTQAYFNKTKERWFGDVDLRLAQLCLTYASFPTFASAACTTWDAWNERVLLFPFFQYIAHNLGNFASVRHPNCRYLLEKFYLSAPHVQSCLQSRFVYFDHEDKGHPKLDHFEKSNGIRLAMEHRIFDIIPYLLSQGLDQIDESGYSLIHHAARKSLPECIQLLVSTPGFYCDVEDAKGRTALSYACESKYHLETVQLLLGVDLGAPSSLGPTGTHHGVMEIDPPVSKANINHRDQFGRTALFYAISAGNDAYTVKPLLTIDGIDCNTPDLEGKLPLHLAAQAGDMNTFRLLLKQPGVALGLRSRDKDGRTPLSYAVELRHQHLAKAIIAMSEAEVTTPEEIEQVFMRCVSHSDSLRDSASFYQEVVKKVLLDGGPLIEDCGASLVLMAAFSGDESSLRTALSIPGITVNLRDSAGNTPVAHCISLNNETMCRMLLARDDVDVNTCDEHGSSPFHLTAQWGNVDIMRSLLERPTAQFHTKDSFGTPLQYATFKDHAGIVELLLEKYEATKCSFTADTGITWKSTPHNERVAQKAQRWLEKDMPVSTDLNEGSENVKCGVLLVIAAANNTPDCFALLEAHLKVWSSLPREWRRKCLLVATEVGDDATFDYILKLVQDSERAHTRRGAGIIHLGRQTWDEVDIFDIAARATARELNSWDTQGQTAIHSAANRKDMRLVRICMALGGDHTTKNSAGKVAEECMQDAPEVLDDDNDNDYFVYRRHVQPRLSKKYQYAYPDSFYEG